MKNDEMRRMLTSAKDMFKYLNAVSIPRGIQKLQSHTINAAIISWLSNTHIPAIKYTIQNTGTYKQKQINKNMSLSIPFMSNSFLIKSPNPSAIIPARAKNIQESCIIYYI